MKCTVLLVLITTESTLYMIITKFREREVKISTKCKQVGPFSVNGKFTMVRRRAMVRPRPRTRDSSPIEDYPRPTTRI